MSELVLIVEDDHVTRAGLAAILTEAGYEAIAAGTPGTAIKALMDDRPDLLLASMELEGSNGLQLVAVNPHQIPSILLSSFRDPVLESEAHHLGAEYVVTPIAPSRLLEIVRYKLSRGCSTITRPRRWTRKAVGESWRVQVEDSQARVLDVSYGGLRLEVERAPGAWLPLSFSVVMPSAPAPFDVNVVWKRRNGETTWVCGAAVAEQNRAAWRQLVDAMS